jgi:hypothetical protein
MRDEDFLPFIDCMDINVSTMDVFYEIKPSMDMTVKL